MSQENKFKNVSKENEYLKLEKIYNDLFKKHELHEKKYNDLYERQELHENIYSLMNKLYLSSEYKLSIFDFIDNDVNRVYIHNILRSIDANKIYDIDTFFMSPDEYNILYEYNNKIITDHIKNKILCNSSIDDIDDIIGPHIKKNNTPDSFLTDSDSNFDSEFNSRYDSDGGSYGSCGSDDSDDSDEFDDNI